MGAMENVTKNIIWIIEHEDGGNASALARKLDVPRQTVNNWTKGRNTPDIELILKIAVTYGKDLNWMVLEAHE